MGMMSEFKEFAMKGNLVDMAVGFIMGGAFATVVKSLVSDVIMPPIGLLLGGVDFAELGFTWKDADVEAGTEAVVSNYGLLINNIISFVTVALVVFLVIKAMNEAKKKEEEAAAEPEAPPAQEVLLTEIRDLLSNK